MIDINVGEKANVLQPNSILGEKKIKSLDKFKEMCYD